MGRPPVPIDLLIKRGKSHLSKKEIEERKAKEIKINKLQLIAPAYLDSEQQEEVHKLTKRLTELNIVTDIDADVVGRYIMAKRMYEYICTVILKEPKVLMSPQGCYLLSNQDKACKQCDYLGAQLGLTPLSRAKLVQGKKEKEEDKKVIEFERKFGNL